jgi:uncharacterized protein
MSKVVIEQLNKEEQERRGIPQWPIWTKEVSTFQWYYDADEQCQILEGEVNIETRDGNYNIKAGDFVTFKTGLDCVWDIKKPIKKHYNFD